MKRNVKCMNDPMVDNFGSNDGYKVKLQINKHKKIKASKTRLI